jgi:hypothetical protein
MYTPSVQCCSTWSWPQQWAVGLSSAWKLGIFVSMYFWTPNVNQFIALESNNNAFWLYIMSNNITESKQMFCWANKYNNYKFNCQLIYCIKYVHRVK